MRWIFQCFEGIELLHIHWASGSLSLALRLQPMHRLVLALLGPLTKNLHNLFLRLRNVGCVFAMLFFLSLNYEMWALVRSCALIPISEPSGFAPLKSIHSKEKTTVHKKRGEGRKSWAT